MSPTLFERAQAFVDARLLTLGEVHLIARAAARFGEADAAHGGDEAVGGGQSHAGPTLQHPQHHLHPDR